MPGAIAVTNFPYPCTLEDCIFYECTSETWNIILLSSIKSPIKINRVCFDSCICGDKEVQLIDVAVIKNRTLLNFTHVSFLGCQAFTPFVSLPSLYDVNISGSPAQNIYVGTYVYYSIFELIQKLLLFDESFSILSHNTFRFQANLYINAINYYHELFFTNCFIKAKNVLINFIGDITLENCTLSSEFNQSLQDNSQFHLSSCKVGSSFPTIEKRICAQDFEKQIHYVTGKQKRLTALLHLFVEVQEALFEDIISTSEGGGIYCQQDIYSFSIIHSSFVSCQALIGGGLYLEAIISNFSKNCFKSCYAYQGAAFYIKSGFNSHEAQLCYVDFPNQDNYGFDSIVEMQFPISESNFSNIISYTNAFCLDMAKQDISNTIFSNIRTHQLANSVLNAINCYVINFMPPNEDFPPIIFSLYDYCINSSFYNITITKSSTLDIKQFERYINCKTDSELFINLSSNFVYSEREELPSNDYCFVFQEVNNTSKILLYVIPPTAILCIIIVILTIYLCRVRFIAKKELRKNELQRKILSDFG